MGIRDRFKPKEPSECLRSGLRTGRNFGTYMFLPRLELCGMIRDGVERQGAVEVSVLLPSLLEACSACLNGAGIIVTLL